MPTSLSEPRPLNEEQFQKAIVDLVEDAESYVDANWKPHREEGWERYKGKVDARPEPGGDQVVVAEVRDAILQLMPEIMEQLAGSEEPIEYYTNDPAKVPLTKQATQMALGIWAEGGGWTAIHDACMHAAVGRVGCLKVYRHERMCMTDEDLEGAPEEVDATASQPGYMQLEREDIEAEALDETGQPIRYVSHSKARVRHYYVDAKLTFDAPYPGEIICTQTGDPDAALCIGQKSTVRMADLRAMGLDLAELDEVEGHDTTVEDERAAEAGEETHRLQDYGSWALKPVTLYELYVLLDADGDGLLERYKVIAAGDDKTVLRVEPRQEITDQPYVLFPFRRSPQTIQGLSVTDLVQDLQETKTKLLRDVVDNTHDVGSPMILASGTVNYAQLQSWRRHKVIDERVTNSVRFFQPPPIAGEVLPVLEHLNSISEMRLGVGRGVQGLQPDSLTSVSAIAVAGMQQAAQRSLRLTVRTIAELGLRPAFKKLLRLMVGEPPRAVIGEEGGHVVVDPRKLDPAWQVRVKVGLGAMAADEKKAAYREAIALTAQLLGAPPPYSQLTTPDKTAGLIQAAVAEFKGLGLARFYSTPEEMQQAMAQAAQQPPPPDPKMIEAQGKLQIAGQKAQADAAAKGQKVQGDMALQQVKLSSGLQLQGAKTQADMQSKSQQGWLRFQADMEKIRQQTYTDRIELAQEARLEKYAIDKQAKSGQGNINRSGK